MNRFIEKFLVGYAKSLIPIISIAGMIQYHVEKPWATNCFAFLFILGYIINEFAFGEQDE